MRLSITLFCLRLAAQPFAYVANYGSNSVSVIDTASKPLKASTPIPVGIAPWGVAASPDGSRVYVSNSSLQANSISVITTGSNKVIDTINVVPAQSGMPATAVGLTAVQATPDNKQLYVADFSAAVVYPIDLTTTPPKVGQPIAVGPNPENMALTPDGAKLYVTSEGGLNAPITIIDTTAKKAIGSIVSSGAGNPNGIAISSDGNTAYVGHDTYGSFLSIIDLQHGTIVKTLPVNNGGGNAGVVMDQGSSNVYIANANNPGTITRFSVGTHSFLPPIQISPPPSLPGGLAMMPGNGSIYITNRLTNSVSVFDTQTQTVPTTVQVGSTPMGIAFAGRSAAASEFTVSRPGASEPALAVDPFNPQHVVIAFNYSSGSTVLLYETVNGGEDWLPFQVRFPGHFQPFTDPWLRYGSNRTLVFSVIAEASDFPGAAGVFVAVSPTGWASDFHLARQVTAQFCGPADCLEGIFPDHPSVGVLPLQTGVQRIVTCWGDRIADKATSIKVTFSDDAGLTWSNPKRLATSSAHDTGGVFNCTVGGSTTEVGIMWWDSRSEKNGIYISTSTDGEHWHIPAKVADAGQLVDAGTFVRENVTTITKSQPYGVTFPGDTKDFLRAVVQVRHAGLAKVLIADRVSQGPTRGPEEWIAAPLALSNTDNFLPGAGTCGLFVGSYVSQMDGALRYAISPLSGTSGLPLFISSEMSAGPFLGDYTSVDCSGQTGYAAWSGVYPPSKDPEVHVARFNIK